jgi:hypothetical protein
MMLAALAANAYLALNTYFKPRFALQTNEMLRPLRPSLATVARRAVDCDYAGMITLPD